MGTWIDVNEFIDEPLRFSHKDEATAFLKSICTRGEIGDATYLGVAIPVLRVRRNYVITTYNRAWAERYYANNYQSLDPVITDGLRSIMPFDWKDGIYSDRKVMDFFDDAESFGIGRMGLSIPVRGAHGERALFSFTADMSPREWSVFKTVHASDLITLAYQFHLAVMVMEGASLLPDISLSNQECEVLRWAAEGKTLKETGIILSLSPRTVDFYLHNAFSKLGAVNKAQAVAKATQYDLLA